MCVYECFKKRIKEQNKAIHRLIVRNTNFNHTVILVLIKERNKEIMITRAENIC